MTRYVPREIDPEDNVNVTRGNPLGRFAILAAEIAFAVMVLYILLGLAVGVLAPHVPASVEKRMGALFTSDWESQALPEETEKAQGLMDRLVVGLEEDDRHLDYRVFVVPGDQVNAVALPGGLVLVFSGLVDKVDDDSQLAFVLGHELGHFHNRDHLRALGRGLVSLVFALAVSGGDSAATGFVHDRVGDVERRFSHAREKAADRFGLHLLHDSFGEVQGALDFMETIAADEKRGKLAYYFSTHPHPDARLEYLREEIAGLE
ncbi:MAG: M48 family metallopeptidase [Desulfatibacillaceae bacterium]